VEILMKLPTLYSRRSDGQVQEWTTEVQGDKYRFTSGIVNGALTESEWTVAKAKNTTRSNRTTPAEQALKEAHAAWQKKVDKGYRESVADIDNISFTEPMLAKEFKGTECFPVYSQPKLDGIRCIARKDGLWSRNGKPFVSCPHIAQSLRELFVQEPSLILDGEFYADKFATNFNAICELVKRSKLKDSDIEKSKAIQYWIYDLPSHKGTFSERWDALNKLIIPNNILHLVPTRVAGDNRSLDEYYGEYVSAGYEGQMVRLDSPYEFKRSKSLLKRKEFKDEEYTILDIEEGDGNRSGGAGAAILSINASGGATQFRSNIKGDRAFCTRLLRDRLGVIGKKATVKYFNLTPDGIPRFPYVIAIRDYE
jgi:DNA ligase-1